MTDRSAGVTIHAGTPEAVALRLMDKIGVAEMNTKAGEGQGGREYWLKLYDECLTAVTRNPVR